VTLSAALALFDLALPGRIAFEGLVALLGVLFIVSPWVMGFSTGFAALAWTVWIVGIVALVAPRSSPAHCSHSSASQHWFSNVLGGQSLATP
jgi:hypothetical protein